MYLINDDEDENNQLSENKQGHFVGKNKTDQIRIVLNTLIMKEIKIKINILLSFN